MAYEKQIEELKSQFNELPSDKQKLVIFGFAAIVLLICFLMIFLIQEDLQSSEDKIKRKYQRLEKILAQKSDLDIAKEMIRIEKEKIRKAGKISLISFLGEKARVLNIEIGKINQIPSKGKKKDSEIYEEAVSLRIRNISYPKLQEFLLQVENSPYVLKITAIKIKQTGLRN